MPRTKLRNGYVLIRHPLTGSVENQILNCDHPVVNRNPLEKLAGFARFVWSVYKSI